MRKKPKTSKAADDAAVNKAFDHLCNLVTTERLLRVLNTQALAAVAMAVMALANRQDDWNDDGLPVETPLETLTGGASYLNTPNRNAIGLIMGAMANTQSEMQHKGGKRAVMRRVTKMLDDLDERRGSAKKKSRK